MNKLKKYSTFDEMKSDYIPEKVSDEDIIRLHKEIQEFAKTLKNETKKPISSTERSGSSKKIFEKLFSYWQCLGIIS